MERDFTGNTRSRDVTGDFNSRAHVERDGDEIIVLDGKYDFNSRAHVERDGWARRLDDTNLISTHALTWSATQTLY